MNLAHWIRQKAEEWRQRRRLVRKLNKRAEKLSHAAEVAKRREQFKTRQLEKYRAWRKKRRRMAQASRRRNRPKKEKKPRHAHI